MPAPSRIAEGTRFGLRVATSVRSSARNSAAPTSSAAIQACRRTNVVDTSTLSRRSAATVAPARSVPTGDGQDGPVSALAVALALAAAALFAVAAAAQQRSAAAVPLWWGGTLADGGRYVGQAAALGLGSLLLVQPLLVTSLLFALPLGARWAGRRLGRAE